MAAALGTWSAVTATAPKRVEGHTSNVEHPINYVQYITGIVGETTEAGDTYIIPHKLTDLEHINLSCLSSTAPSFLYGTSTTIGAYHSGNGVAVAWTALTTAATAGASTLVLTGASALADVYNNCWLDIRYSSGDVQTVKITDYAVTTKIATLAEPLAEAVATSGSVYRVRGTVLTTASASVTPTLGFEVIGRFD